MSRPAWPTRSRADDVLLIIGQRQGAGHIGGVAAGHLAFQDVELAALDAAEELLDQRVLALLVQASPMTLLAAAMASAATCPRRSARMRLRSTAPRLPGRRSRCGCALRRRRRGRRRRPSRRARSTRRTRLLASAWAVSDDLLSFLLGVGAGFRRHAGIFQALRDTLLALLEQVDDRPVSPGRQHDHHDEEVEDLDAGKTLD